MDAGRDGCMYVCDGLEVRICLFGIGEMRAKVARRWYLEMICQRVRG